MPIVNNIIANHAHVANVVNGQIVIVEVDKIYLQDGNTPTIRNLFTQYEFDSVFNANDITVFFDHSVLSSTIEISDRLKEAEEFAHRFNLNIVTAGEGISHVVALEQGLFKPGNLVVASDSHACTGGAVQSLALGLGASDVAAAMVLGKTWLKVPETIWIETIGTPSSYATAKDVMLYALAKFKDNRFLYKSIEWFGKWFETISQDQAATIANMTVELGAKCTFLPPWHGAPSELHSIKAETECDDESSYAQLDLTDLPPFIAKPHSPNLGVPLDECAKQKIDYVFVGSCANSRLSDLAEVAQILQGNKINKNVKFIVTPGSKKIYLEALKQGLIETILKSGGIITPPGCGSCVGTQGYIPASGEQVLSTMNRNFLGRMGNPKAAIYLASPLIAAFTALLGYIPSLNDLSAVEVCHA